MQQVITPVGRLVQGDFKLYQKKDDNDQPVFKDSKPVMETYMAIAVDKNNPDWLRFYNEIYAVARAECALYFNPQGQCTHPAFSWKIKDGDGVDGNGQPLSGKPGFAGCWIISCTTQFMPDCYHEGKFAAHEIIQDPTGTIKKGYYVRAFLRVAGNGVTPADKNRKPGIFMSQEKVSLVGYGDVINSGVDAAVAFAAPVAYMPPGMSTVPTVAPGAAPGLAPPPMPGQVAAPAPAAYTAPPAPVAQPMAPPPPPAAGIPLPPAANQPQYVMTAKAMGATRDQLIQQGWQSDEQLIQHGMMVLQA